MAIISQLKVAGNNTLKEGPINPLVKNQLDGLIKILKNGQNTSA